MKSYRVYVSAEDIRNGDRHSFTTCPVALALRRRFSRYKWIVVNYRIERIPPRGYTKYIESPKSVKQFILLYDEQATIKPFRFTLKVP